MNLSWPYRFVKHRVQNVICSIENAKPAFSNSSGLKNDYEKLRFCDGSEDSKLAAFKFLRRTPCERGSDGHWNVRWKILNQ